MTEDYYQFLMFELEEMIQEQDEPSEQALMYIVTIAAGGRSIQESIYASYAQLAKVDYNQLIIYSALCSGMGFISIDCDCGGLHCLANEVKNHPAWASGERDRDMASEAYKNIANQVAEITSVIYN